MRSLVIILLCATLLSFRQSSEITRQVSMNFTARILEKGKYLVTEGQVYFRKKDGVLTTRLSKPFVNITIVDKAGDMKIYDPVANTVVYNSSDFNSTESSYLWHFLNGAVNDLGYSKTGYAIKTSKVDKGLMITHWAPKSGYSTPIAGIELVHEKNLPIYVAFTNHRNKKLGKIFFSSYRKIGDMQMPLKVVEIMYKGARDSVVTTKTYSNPVINEKVDERFIDFKIPSNARVIPAK
jgi:hypothetical protein